MRETLNYWQARWVRININRVRSEVRLANQLPLYSSGGLQYSNGVQEQIFSPDPNQIWKRWELSSSTRISISFSIIKKSVKVTDIDRERWGQP